MTDAVAVWGLARFAAGSLFDLFEDCSTVAGELRAITDLGVLGDVPLEVTICLPRKVVGAEANYFTLLTAMTPALGISYLPPHHRRLSKQSVEPGQCRLRNFLLRAENLEPVRRER